MPKFSLLVPSKICPKSLLERIWMTFFLLWIRQGLSFVLSSFQIVLLRIQSFPSSSTIRKRFSKRYEIGFADRPRSRTYEFHGIHKEGLDCRKQIFALRRRITLKHRLEIKRARTRRRLKSHHST